MPCSLVNQRRTREGSTPKRRSSASRRRRSGARSIAASSGASHGGAAPAGASGRQRRQGRKPAKSASREVAKKRMCSGFGGRAGQVGRQKIPVVVTPVKKRPS